MNTNHLLSRLKKASQSQSKLARITMRRKTFLTPLLYFIAFLVRAHNFAEYINSTTVFLHSKYSNVASVRKKCSKCVLKFIEPARLSPYQLMVVAEATRQSPHYFTQYFQVMSRILNLKCCRFNISRPTIGLADDLHKKSHKIRRLFMPPSDDLRMGCQQPIIASDMSYRLPKLLS